MYINPIKIEHYQTRAEAVAAEEKAIRKEHPRFNLTFQLPYNAVDLYRQGKLRPTRFREKDGHYYFDTLGKPRYWIPLGASIYNALDEYEKHIRGVYEAEEFSTKRRLYVVDSSTT